MEKLNREEKITVINITHYMEEAARADRVIVINDGSLVFDGSAKEVFSNVQRLHEIGLEAPQGKELVHLLMRDGLIEKSDALSADECTEAVLNLLKKN